MNSARSRSSTAGAVASQTVTSNRENKNNSITHNQATNYSTMGYTPTSTKVKETGLLSYLEYQHQAQQRSASATGIKSVSSTSRVKHHLVKVDLKNRQLKAMPSHISQNVGCLILDSNPLTKIGMHVLPCALVQLSMTNCQLTQIQTEDIEICARSLKVLNLSGNRLERISALYMCTQLRDLNLQNNSVTDAEL